MGSEVPKVCKAAVVQDEGPNFSVKVIDDFPVPEIGPNDLLLKLNATGLCMSDLHFMMNDWNVPPMSTFGVRCAGHEGAGEVVKVGENVQGWKVGDRAGLKPIYTVCRNCEQCYNGKENYCEKGIYTGLAANGSYQQYVTSPAYYTTRIPDGVSDYVAGPIMCSASTMHRALIDAGFVASNWVAFPGGGGGVGIQGVQLAAAMGFRPIVIDSGEDKKKLSMECGAEVFIDFKEESDVKAAVIKAADGIGVHGVIVTGYQAYKDAIDFVGRRVSGTVVCVALPPAGYYELHAEPSRFVFKNLRIMGSLVGTMQDAAACLEYARRGKLKSICEVRGTSRWQESVEQLKAGKVAGRIVIDFNQD